MNINRWITSGILLLTIFTFSCQNKQHLQITDLRCEYLTNPLGIDVERPRFSWIIESEGRDILQSKYQIELANSPEGLSGGQGLVWNTGWASSRQSLNVDYTGADLSSHTTYYWKVRIRDQHGHKSGWSNPAFFHTGFMRGDSFKARWICSPDRTLRSPLFRKYFTTGKSIKKAFLYISALGLYEAYLNGNKVNDTAFEPPITQYSEKLLYSTKDVTKYLREGENTIGLWLGEGMAAFTLPSEDRFVSATKPVGPFDRPMALAQLEILYRDGSQKVIITDKSWKWTQSPVVFNNYYGGEDYDARLEIQGWAESELNDKDWEPVITSDYQGKLRAVLIPPVQEHSYHEPKVSIRRDEYTIEFDLGTTITGNWFIEVKGKPGTHITVRSSEACGSNLEQRALSNENQIFWGKYHEYNHGYYSRDCWSTYILKGEGIEQYKPRFFYNGFRYLQLKVDNPEDFEVLNIRGVEIHDALENLGFFRCSNKLLNIIHDNTVRTFKDIFMQGIPLSNPHSEKYGWTGDITLVSETANYMFYMPAFWTKWLNDFKDAQNFTGNGIIPVVVPEIRDKKSEATAAWSLVYPSLVWEMYKYYMDEKILIEHFEDLTAWYKHLMGKAEDYIIGGIWADHNSPGIWDGKFIKRGKTQEIVHLVNTAYLYKTNQFMQNISHVLEKTQEEEKYRQDAHQIWKRFNALFYHEILQRYFENPPPKGFINEHTSNLVPLQMDLVPEEWRAQVLNFVIEDIISQGNKFYTGILGTKALVDVLQQEHLLDFLYLLINQKEFPGWAYCIDQGATSIWQNWNGDGDFIHVMFGSVNEFFYQNILGIKLDFSQSSKTLIIHPYMPDDMTFAEGQVQTGYGLVTSQWEKDNNQVKIRIHVPHNVEGKLIFPKSGNQYSSISESGKVIYQDDRLKTFLPGIKSVKTNPDSFEIEVGSGSYSFLISNL